MRLCIEDEAMAGGGTTTGVVTGVGLGTGKGSKITGGTCVSTSDFEAAEWILYLSASTSKEEARVFFCCKISNVMQTKSTILAGDSRIINREKKKT